MVRLRNVRVVIITGLSGSGKSTALRALEDTGFLCVDNLPVELLPRFLEMRESGSPEATKVALVMDLREPDFLSRYQTVFLKLDRSGFKLEIVFLEASDDALIRRYSQTRRTHPMADASTSLAEAIVKERKALAGLRDQADLIIDTTNLSVHELKARIVESFSGPMAVKRLRITLISFGFKYGLPHEADIVMDVRFLPNPYFVEGLRDKNGGDDEVIDFVFKNDEASVFINRLTALLSDLLPLYEKEGKAYLTVGVGCTGGRHRSVAVVNRLRDQLEPAGYEIAVRHRDIELG